MAALHITRENFEKEVLQSEKKVLVDFWASWCGPCKMVSPLIDEIADEQDAVKVCKVNVDEQPELAQAFGVMSIPTLVVIEGGKIVGFGEYEGETEYDISGKIAVPGLIDAHVHIESSQLSPEEFAKLVLPRGTTTVVADPHEITNVCGIAGAQYIAQACARTPLEAKVMLPSCVPATAFETSGAVLTGADTEKYIREDFIYGLGEFMNYPGVIYKDKEVLRKLYDLVRTSSPMSEGLDEIESLILDEAETLKDMVVHGETDCILPQAEKIRTLMLERNSML